MIKIRKRALISLSLLISAVVLSLISYFAIDQGLVSFTIISVLRKPIFMQCPLPSVGLSLLGIQMIKYSRFQPTSTLEWLSLWLFAQFSSLDLIWVLPLITQSKQKGKLRNQLWKSIGRYFIGETFSLELSFKISSLDIGNKDIFLFWEEHGLQYAC